MQPNSVLDSLFFLTRPLTRDRDHGLGQFALSTLLVMNLEVALVLALILLIAFLIRANRAREEGLSIGYAPRKTEIATIPSTISERKINYSYNKPDVHPWCELPDFSNQHNTRLTFPSMSEPGVAYHVDLAAYTCTCPDWVKLRGNFPSRDFKRACKHIVALLLQRDGGHQLNDLMYTFLGELLGGVPTNCTWIVAQVDGFDVLIVAREGNSWLDIVTVTPKPRQRRPYQRFGFNRDERRWSYGRRPRNAALIRRIIDDLPEIAERHRPSALAS